MGKKRTSPPEVACHGKEPLATMKRAQDIAKAMSRRHDAGIRPYHCPYCGHYHVGEAHTKGPRNVKRE